LILTNFKVIPFKIIYSEYKAIFRSEERYRKGLLNAEGILLISLHVHSKNRQITGEKINKLLQL